MLIPKIEEIVKKRGYMKKFVAEQIDMSPQQFNNLIKGKNFTTTEKLFKLAKFLDVRVDDLYEYNEED
ncbi:helix-turn-helix transcriptional regulator [Schinkia azotoformans]|uniref:Helix-turn-helix domain-containing protein n=1 Tax=Schinkia azotoformans LMG 9581 TaxID=1131731 RepID=K6D6F4_SCHAZ|nr:helix-turn-helix transcriptional regulator [Schinkia azotoformans]EKN68087.1 helix-turn-helix domain-containing protein [Schinkia azotoformans LMG 9581]MEC1638109.1 helix-turn-helix transcriptional regulator [Schinkia azotoformans]MEC1946457.1 helix-turn-helix transcriptional regulator [Schinkia azotoformans]